MNQHGAWSPYAGGGAIILAVVLLIVTGVLTYSGIRLRHPLAVKRPGTLLGVTIVVIWLVSVITFLVAITVYVLALYQQAGGHINAPTNPITPVTMVSGAIAFFVILSLAQNSGFRVASGSAIVGTIAAPMIFAVWALFGFAYPSAPIPIALNVISKIVAFATAVSLFLPQEKGAKIDKPQGDRKGFYPAGSAETNAR